MNSQINKQTHLTHTHTHTHIHTHIHSFPESSVGKEPPTMQRPWFDPWVGKIP